MKNINKPTGYFIVTIFWLAVLTLWSSKYTRTNFCKHNTQKIKM